MPKLGKTITLGLMLAMMVAFVLLAIPRSATIGCPEQPGPVVVTRNPETGAGYCAYSYGERGVLRPIPGALATICAEAADKVHAHAEALYEAAKRAHERCAPPPTLADAARFYGRIIGVSE